MAEITIINYDNNIKLDELFLEERIKVDLIYADCIYDSKDLSWVFLAYELLKENGIFIVQTDYHTVVDYKLELDSLGLSFVNWCIYINDWGGTPKKGFPRKHDDILIYCNGDDYYWDKSGIEIPKGTAGTKFVGGFVPRGHLSSSRSEVCLYLILT